jgi:hypothetical protein
VAPGRGPVPYREFDPKSSESIPPLDQSSERRRVRSGVVLLIGAALLTGLAVGLWPIFLGTFLAAAAAAVCAVLGLSHFLWPEAFTEQAAKPPPAGAPEAEVGPGSVFRSHSRQARWVRSGLLVLAAISLGASVALPWYVFSTSSGYFVGANPIASETQTMYLGTSITVATTTCGAPCTSSSQSLTYAQAGLNATGTSTARA